jgi:hypothetical protein
MNGAEGTGMLEVEESTVHFAIIEAQLLAHKGVSAEQGARELLRWIPRRRQVLEQAVTRLQEDTEIEPEVGIRRRAEEILERALTIGLFY